MDHKGKNPGSWAIKGKKSRIMGHKKEKSRSMGHKRKNPGSWVMKGKIQSRGP